MSVHTDAWIGEIRGWVGVPVRHRGVGRGGVDCSGLIIGAAERLGVTVDRGFLNGTMPTGDQVTAAVMRYADPIYEARPGCVVQMYLGSEPRHLGVYVGDNQVVHAKGRKRRVVLTAMPSRFFALWWPNWLEELDG